MFRVLAVTLLGLLLAEDAWASRCRLRDRAAPAPAYYVPVYPLLPTPAPFVPKAGVGVREDEEAPFRPRVIKPSSDREPPRIAKPKLPIPELPDEIEIPAKKEPIARSRKVEQFIVPADEKQSQPSREVRVGFFNHSDREVLLTVNGESLKIPSEQYVTVRLPRTFSWQERGQAKTDVAVPPDADGLEIVFRK